MVPPQRFQLPALGSGRRKRWPRAFPDHEMVVATSSPVPHPGPAERPASMALPALALLLAAGLLHTQVSKQGRKVRGSA